MASPEKIAPLPETLPEDFSDWDGEASAAPSPAHSSDWESWDSPHSNGKSQKAPIQSADRDAILESLMDRPASHPAPPAPAPKQQRDISHWDNELSPAPKPTLVPAPAPEPVHRNEWAEFDSPHSNGNSPKPLGRSADRDAILESLVESPRVSSSPSPAPAVVDAHNDFADRVSEAIRTPPSAPAPTPAPATADRNEWDAFVEAPHSFDGSQKPLVQSAGDSALLPPAVDAPPAPASVSPAPSAAKPQNGSAVQNAEAAPKVAPASINRDEWEAFETPHSAAKSQMPTAQSAGRDAILPPVVEKPPASDSISPAPAAAKQKRDLTEWDREAPSKASTTPKPSPTPINRSEWDALEPPPSFGKPQQKPLGQSASRDAISPPVLDRPRVSSSASPAPASLKPQKYPSAPGEIIPGRVSHTAVATYPMNEVPTAPGRTNGAITDGKQQSSGATATAVQEAEEGHFPSFQSLDAEAEDEKKATKKKWMMIAVVSVCSMLLVLFLISQVLQHGAKTAAKQSVQPVPAASDAQPDTDTPASVATDPTTQQKAPATPANQQTIDPKPSPSKSEAAANPAPVQSQMMNDQLTAPTQIPREIKNQVAENEPPPASFGAAGADGLGGSDASGSVFNSQAKPVVKPSKPITVSAGVVEGMLIQKTPPLYPSIAKSARVSGTVKLEATISKTGAIKDLHVVSGPEMLRPAALDAVRNWRYKPYKLNNEPVEIESMINVVFTLGQ